MSEAGHAVVLSTMSDQNSLRILKASKYQMLSRWREAWDKPPAPGLEIEQAIV